MKVVLQRRTRVALSLVLTCLLHVQVPLQAQKKVASAVTNHPTSKLGEVKVDIRSLQPSRLLETLRSNIFTDVTLDIAGQPHTFRVSISSRVTILNSGQSVYDGPDQSDPNNKIFMLLSEQRSDITITLGDREYLIAPTENVDDKNSAQKSEALPGVTTFGAYSLIDQQELGKWAAENTPASRSAEIAPVICGADMLAEKNNATAKDWIYKTNLTGYIGKRELYLHVYGAINQDRLPAFVNNINNIFTHDERFNDIRLVVIQHTSGETSNQIIDGSDLFLAKKGYHPFSDMGEILNKFRDKVGALPKFKIRINEYHIYLSEDKWDLYSEGEVYANVYGVGYNPGNFSIAQYKAAPLAQYGYAVPLHEFSHNLGAKHTTDVYHDGGSKNSSYHDDLMKSPDEGTSSRGLTLMWHYNDANRNRIHDEVNAVSIKDEILDGTYTPTIHNWDFSEDLLTVSDNTGNTSFLTTAPMDSDPVDRPFEDGVSGDRLNRWKIKVYKIKIPKRSIGSVYYGYTVYNQTYLQIRITEADFDTYLYILDENGNVIAKDDDSGGSLSGPRRTGYELRRSYVSGMFNADKYYYVIVRGFNPSRPDKVAALTSGGESGNFELKIRYSYSEGGWLMPKNSNGRQASELAPLAMTDAPDQSRMLMSRDGSLIDVSDFGINDKSLTPEVAPQLSLNVYPNPVKDGVLHVQQEGLTVNDSYSLFNSEGKVVQEGKLQPSDKNGLSIKLNSSAKGLLVLRIRSIADGSARTAKIVVE